MFPLAPAASSRPRRLAPLLALALLAAASAALTTAAVLRPTPAAAPPAIVTIPVAVPTATAPALEPRPCLPGREHWIAAEPRHGHRLPVTDSIVETCHDQLALVTAAGVIRVVLVSGDAAHIVELPRLAVPTAIDHFRWDAGIDIVAGKGELIVVGQDRNDLSRVIAMVSADGGATWTERYLGTIAPRTMVSDAHMRPSGELTWTTWPEKQRRR